MMRLRIKVWGDGGCKKHTNSDDSIRRQSELVSDSREDKPLHLPSC
ncbi:MAG: hypothetical protein IJC11_01500 [Alphaproteobacteria bacterium]|nr:hypothetical protein [Alphaproteobacteria bacterium]